jgi:L-2-hydroxyglutarate oxidase LhgO
MMRLGTPKEIFNFDYLVIGAGAVGLASARRLNQLSKRGIIIEKNHDLGLGNSSRNSGVIYAGIYYEKDSLKAKTMLGR